MQDLTDRPLVCVTLALASGIALAAAWGRPALAGLAACAAGALALWALRRGPACAGLAALAVAAAIGGVLWEAGQVRPAHHVNRLRSGGHTLVGTVASAPRHQDGWWRFVLDCEAHVGGPRASPVSGAVYVRLRSSQPLARGERWRLTGRLRALRGPRNPGDRSEAQRLAPLGVDAVLTVGAQELAQRVGAGHLSAISAHAYTAQRRALALLERHVQGPYPELSAQVAASVIFGVHAAPPAPEVTEAFRRAGTIHLLVVSGAMVSLVFGFVFLPGLLGASWRRLRVERQADWPVTGRGRVRHWPGVTAAAVGGLVVVYYALLTEGGLAVARAAAMGIFLALSYLLRRTPVVARHHGLNVDPYTLLAAAALFILAGQPAALSQAGFQLSFAAVWAILFLTPKLARALPTVPSWLTGSVGGTLAAQLASFPLLAWHYGQAPVGGLGANLLAVPLAAVVLAGGMATCLLGLVAPWLAAATGWVTGWAARWMVWVSAAAAALPGACWEVARPGWAAIIGWYAGLAFFGWLLSKRARAEEADEP